MRSMTFFNFLLEATLFGAVLILVLVAVRALLRDRLGSLAIYVAWLAPALRLLLPLSLPNPVMDSLRPAFSTDVAARPVADQVRQRVIDVGLEAGEWLPGGLMERIAQQTSEGALGRVALHLWAIVALGVAVWLCVRAVQFRRRVRRDRVAPLEGEAQQMYLSLCERYGVKRPLPVYYVDRLRVTALVGMCRRFIAVPMNIPKEQLSLVLAHELCHHRAQDPIWGMVRNACMALHWFNPVVWLGVHLSRIDGEMACDDRVTRKLQDIARLAYANAIVSTAERSGLGVKLPVTGASLTGRHIRQRISVIVRCVRGNRWAVALGSLAAAALLVFSFATSESEPLPTVDEPPMVTWSAALGELSDPDAAIACARRFLESPFIGERTDVLGFAATQQEGLLWRVEARRTPDELPLVLRFDTDGHVLGYDGARALSGLSITDTSYTHRAITPSVDEYLHAFFAALLPDADFATARATADVRAGDVRVVDCVLRDEAGSVCCQLTLQVEPEVRVLYFADVRERGTV